MTQEGWKQLAGFGALLVIASFFSSGIAYALLATFVAVVLFNHADQLKSLFGG